MSELFTCPACSCQYGIGVCPSCAGKEVERLRKVVRAAFAWGTAWYANPVEPPGLRDVLPPESLKMLEALDDAECDLICELHRYIQEAADGNR